MTDKRLGKLGLAKRAGKLAVGFDPAIAAVKEGKAALVTLASDLSEKTLKEWRFSLGNASVPMQTLPCTKAELGAAIGAYREVGIVAVCDKGFAASIREACPKQEEE